MANETYDPKKPSRRGRNAQKRPNTIDLTAKEIIPEPSAKPDSQPSTEAVTTSGSATALCRRLRPNRPSSQDRQSRREKPMAATPPQPGAEPAESAPQNAGRAADKAVPPGDDRRAEARPTKGLPWSVIGSRWRLP